MLPSTDDVFIEDMEEEEVESGRTYAIVGDRICGMIDGLEAIEQAVRLILETERYEYQIYSWDYGTERIDLLGMPPAYVCADLKWRITEALTMDDRILDVDNFSFDCSKKKTVMVSFTVHTTFGDLNMDKEVDI